MNLPDAIKDAKKAARDCGYPVVVVHAPIEEAENESGCYGFCPAMAKDILYRWATVVKTVKP
jgi:hypothetical protein